MLGVLADTWAGVMPFCCSVALVFLLFSDLAGLGGKGALLGAGVVPPSGCEEGEWWLRAGAQGCACWS